MIRPAALALAVSLPLLAAAQEPGSAPAAQPPAEKAPAPEKAPETQKPAAEKPAPKKAAPKATGEAAGAKPSDKSAPLGKLPSELFATFVTSQGKIGVRLFPDQKPLAVKNFVELAEGRKEWTDPRNGQKTKKPLYDGTVFHRVIPNFMIQGGDPLGTGRGTPGFAIPDELQAGEHFFDQPCQLAYANAGPGTSGSQFFITEVPTVHLNPRQCAESPTGLCGYIRFGQGVCGCDLVGKIARLGPGQTTLQKVVISSKPPTCQ